MSSGKNPPKHQEKEIAMDSPSVEMRSILMEEFDSEERKLVVEVLAKATPAKADKTYAPKKIVIKFTANWELMAQHYAQWCYDNKDRRISVCDDAIIAEFVEEAAEGKPDGNI